MELEDSSARKAFGRTTKIFLRSIALCFAMAGAASAYAYEGAKFSYDFWGEAEGLPQSTVSAILQTRDGYLWLGTWGGLARFDGVRFVSFRDHTGNLKENEIRALVESDEGGLWIGTTGGGLTYLKDGKFTTYTTKDGLPDNEIRTLSKDKEGGIWIGTGSGLCRFKNKLFTTFTIEDGLAGDSITALYADSQGRVWAAAGRWLCRFHDERFEKISGPHDADITAIGVDTHGTVWLGTSDGEVSRLKDGQAITYAAKDGLTGHPIGAIYADNSGQVWVGADGGLRRYEGGSFSGRLVSDKSASRLNNIIAICGDSEGSLWIGTEGDGLARLRKTQFVGYTAADGLINNVVYSTFEDRDGGIWMGTASGASRYKDGKFTNLDAKDGLPTARVNSFAEDKDGVLWIGTTRGMKRLKDGKISAFRELAEVSVRVIYRDAADRLWIGTDGRGLARLENGKIISDEFAELTHNAVRTIYQDRRGALWVGTFGGGLSCYRDGKFTTYTTENGLANNYIMALYGDAGDDALWIATRGGLNRLKDGKFTTYTDRDGLFVNFAHQIVGDDNGNLWFSSGQGIFRVSRTDLNEFAEGKTNKVTSVSYGIRDGMLTNVCTVGSQPQGWKTKDGKLWFGTLKGAVTIDPHLPPINAVPPPVHIEEVVGDGVPISFKEQLQLPPGDGDLEIRYTGLSLLAPERVKFKYKLEGFDEQWVEAGARRVAYYTNIPPGKYTFRVTAGNNDSLWNGTGDALEFYLRPHFYQTFWFYLLCAAITATICWWFYLLHIRRIEAQFKAVLGERNRIAREIHDTLIQGVVGISTYLEVLAAVMSDSPQKARAHLDQIRALVRSSLDEARRSVWDLRSQPSGHHDLATALLEITRKFTADRPLLRVRTQVTGVHRDLSKAIEDNLLRIGQEAIINAVRHSQASRIDIKLNFDEKHVQLLVADDGKGFDEHQLFTEGTEHFGLLGIRERAKQVGGHVVLRSHPGGGTEVSVAIPLS